MPVTPTSFIRAAGTVIYTVPSGTSILTNMIVTNSGAAAGSFTVTVGGTPLMGNTAIAANSTGFFDLKQVITSGTTISGYGTPGLSFHLSGVLIV